MSEWHFVLNGEKIGPVEEETLKEKISSGEIRSDSHLLKKGWSCWIPAHQTDIYKKTLGIADTSPSADSAEGAESIFISSTGELSIKDAFSFGWNTTKSNLGFLIPVILIFFLAPYVPGTIGMFVSSNVIVFSIAGLLAIIISMLLQMGLIKIALKYTVSQKPEYNDLFNCYPLVLKYLGASIISLIVIGVGIILIVIPGIILGIALQFFTFIIIDKELGAVESLKKSYAITKENWLNIFLFNLYFGFVNFAGALCLGIGLFISIPVSMIAYAHFYRQLIGKETLAQPTQPATDDKFIDVEEKPVEPQAEAPSEQVKEPPVAETSEPEPVSELEEDDLSDINLDDISVEDDIELTVIDEEPEFQDGSEESIEPEPEESPEPKKPLKFQFSDTKKEPEEAPENGDDRER